MLKKLVKKIIIAGRRKMRWNYTISAVRREMRIKANIDKKANIDFLTTKFEKTKLINLYLLKNINENEISTSL